MSEYTCSEEYLTKCSELASKLNLPIHIHYCENKSEIEVSEYLSFGI